MKKLLTSNINNNNIFINQTKRSQLTKVPSGVSAKNGEASERGGCRSVNYCGS